MVARSGKRSRLASGEDGPRGYGWGDSHRGLGVVAPRCRGGQVPPPRRCVRGGGTAKGGCAGIASRRDVYV